jgi:hypothetical protein
VTSEGYTTTPMPRWEQAGTPRRVCAVMGAVIAVLGFAQLGLTIALFTFLAAYLQLYDQEAGTCCHVATRSGLGYLLTPPLAVKALWILPIVIGAGGILVYRLRAPIFGQAVVGAATACLLVATLVTMDIGSVNAPSVQTLISPVSAESVVLVPFCVALAVVAALVRRRDRYPSNAPVRPDQAMNQESLPSETVGR